MTGAPISESIRNVNKRRRNTRVGHQFSVVRTMDVR